MTGAAIGHEADCRPGADRGGGKGREGRSTLAHTNQEAETTAVFGGVVRRARPDLRCTPASAVARSGKSLG